LIAQIAIGVPGACGADVDGAGGVNANDLPALITALFAP